MGARSSSALAEAVALVAPGTPLREGLERVLLADRGALVVVGDDADVLSICTGGFLLDAEFSPQRLSELAKLDGAIILSSDSSRIARANVHLMPNPSIPTSETGTRHRTAERVARSLDVPVISVSASMGVVAVYRCDAKHVLQPTSRLHERANQALQTLQRFRQRFDLAVAALSALELEDTVTARDVAAALAPAELVVRVALEVEDAALELGDDGRFLHLQLQELLEGVEATRTWLVRDYLKAEPGAEAVTGALEALGRLATTEVLDGARVCQVLGVPAAAEDADLELEPRGYRLLHRLPRFPDELADGIVEHFSGLGEILRASLEELEQVPGVGDAQARSVKDGLSRLAEASILDRFA